jgi:hypothetical protein
MQDGWTFDMCFDVDSGLMVRFDTDTGEPNGASKVLISDYRLVNDVQFSFTAQMIANKVRLAPKAHGGEVQCARRRRTVSKDLARG